MRLKILLVGVTVIAIFFSIQTISSFSKTIIKNEAVITSVEQEDALISVIGNNEVSLKPGEEKEIQLDISNRISSTIYLEPGYFEFDGIEISYNAMTLDYLNRDYQPVNIKISSQEEKLSKEIQLPFQFIWQDGEAEIVKNITVVIE